LRTEWLRITAIHLTNSNDTFVFNKRKTAPKRGGFYFSYILTNGSANRTEIAVHFKSH